MDQQKTQQTHESQAELRRCISRLSFVGMGHSDDLDRALVTLRQAIKDNADDNYIKGQVEGISKILLTLEDHTSDSKQSQKIEASQAEIELLKELTQRSIPSSLKSSFDKISKQRNQDTAQLISAIADAIETFISQNKMGTVRPKGMLSRLFGKAEQIDKRGSDTQKQVQEGISPEIKNSLLHLIEQLSALENNSKLATKLAKKVSELKQTSQLVEILEAVASAFVDFTGHEHEQFENFLKSLSKRIDRVNEFINQTVKFNQQFTKQSQLLDTELQGSVKELKTSIDDAQSLTDIKSYISHKIDSILARVNQFCDEQVSNQENMANNCESLVEQLRATEDETSRLKDELAAQRLRAQTDPLTGLPNRYSYNERLTQEYNRWRRYRSPLSLVLADIDFFKQVNDKYGHSAGDLVLREIALFLQSELRESDFVARFGGEEFVMLLPETTLVDATKAMNKLRQGIKQVVVEVESDNIQVAMSFGIAEFENNDTPKAVFNRADQALYRAKDKGRDQVCCQRAKPVKE
ncbi:MAG: diguanylate cyclase [Kangiellaceae bacterium]|nr:diguanylate cyclase [Kangiellaceae bacterium]MCW9000338.1 diguanylate cyclase [Kangiellaceae bacterium]